LDISDFEPVARRWSKPIVGLLFVVGCGAVVYLAAGLGTSASEPTATADAPAAAATGTATTVAGATVTSSSEAVGELSTSDNSGPITTASPAPFEPDIGFTNEKGTFYSTYGANPEALGWLQSTRLIFNQPLPDDTPSVGNSIEMAARIDEIVRGERLYDYGSGFEEGQNAPYMLFVDSDAEDFTEVVFSPEACGADTWWGWSDAEFEPYINGAYQDRDKWGIPLPADFTMNPNDEDFHVMVYDWRADVMIELWKAMPSNLTGRQGIEVCWGGITKEFLSTSQGVYPFPVGVDAAGLTAAGLTITLEDVRRGEIRHAIGVSTELVVNDVQQASFSYPANRNDGLCSATPTSDRGAEVTDAVGGVEFCLFEGQQLRLPAGFDVDAIEHPFARMVAKAGRDYGFVVHDVAGCFCLQAESGLVVTENGFAEANPWLDVYGELAEWEILWQIDWSQLEILPVDWNRPGDHRIACAIPPGFSSDEFPMQGDPRCEEPGDPYRAG
jgi:hypothetical protein